ncbi:MAG TPA: 2-isopropylmalate synthase, partial [Gaiellaceae bacterium]|nr:2-isopropylmalate synthase [Gaiellaceae bacterium]
VFDTTLRDGEQSPGIALAPADKVRIARQLELLGVDVIEAGFAASSPGDFEGVREVARAVRRPTVASLARTRLEDVEAAAAALAGAARSRIHIFIATSPVHMERKLRLEPADVVEQSRAAVARAAELADEVEFSCEDATRSDPAFVAHVAGEAIGAGATTVNLPDTVGYTLPHEYTEFLDEVRASCPELAGVTLSVHCHDDLGMAVANTLAGVRAGAGQVEVTVNGIGERAGNASLEEVAMALRVRAASFGTETGIVPAEIGPASRLVSATTGYVVQPNKAIVGANAFAHEAGIHQDGMLKDRATYQIMDPAELGLETTLPLGKHSGRHAFARAAAEAGFQLESGDLNEAFARLKSLADSGRKVAINDVFAQMEVA